MAKRKKSSEQERILRIVRQIAEHEARGKALEAMPLALLGAWQAAQAAEGRA